MEENLLVVVIHLNESKVIFERCYEAVASVAGVSVDQNLDAGCCPCVMLTALAYLELNLEQKQVKF